MSKFHLNVDMLINSDIEIDLEPKDWENVYSELEKMSTLASAFRIQDYYGNWNQLRQDMETDSMNIFSNELQAKIKEAIGLYCSNNLSNKISFSFDNPEIKTLVTVHGISYCNPKDDQREDQVLIEKKLLCVDKK